MTDLEWLASALLRRHRRLYIFTARKTPLIEFIAAFFGADAARRFA